MDRIFERGLEPQEEQKGLGINKEKESRTTQQRGSESDQQLREGVRRSYVVI